jgi:hypothetical protein
MYTQEFDRMACGPAPSCHPCPAGVNEFLRTDSPAAPKFMCLRREEITEAAAGDGLTVCGMWGVVEGESVVEWDEDCSNVRP